MKSSIDNTFNTHYSTDNVDESNWHEDEFEEIQQETPWEIFSSELNNWSTININASHV